MVNHTRIATGYPNCIYNWSVEQFILTDTDVRRKGRKIQLFPFFISICQFNRSSYHFLLWIEGFCWKRLLVIGFYIHLPMFTTKHMTAWVTMMVVLENWQLFKVSGHTKEHTRYYSHHFYSIILFYNCKRTFWTNNLFNYLFLFVLLTNDYHGFCANFPFRCYLLSSTELEYTYLDIIDKLMSIKISATSTQHLTNRPYYMKLYIPHLEDRTTSPILTSL